MQIIIGYENYALLLPMKIVYMIDLLFEYR